MANEKLKRALIELKPIMDRLDATLGKLENELPQIIKKGQEAEKNRPPRDPLADAW